jgi:uncharacterized protein YbjT (DUF2867 family)
VYGATGHTGRFVVAELERRGLVPVAVARDEAKLAVAGYGARRVETRAASIDDPGSLDRVFADVAAIVNCAGPFIDTAEAVAAAALRLGIHYLDVTAEQPSARATFERFDGAARESGIAPSDNAAATDRRERALPAKLLARSARPTRAASPPRNHPRSRHLRGYGATCLRSG